MTTEPSDLPETPEAALTRKALLAEAVAAVRAGGSSVRAAALSRGLSISTVRSALLAAGARTSPTVSDLIAALARKVDALETRLAAAERELDLVPVDPRLQAELDALPKDAFAGLPGDPSEPKPAPSRSSAVDDRGETK